MSNIKSLGVNKLKLFSHVANIWDAPVGMDDTIEDILNSAYFAHDARKFRNGDFIKASREDGSYVGQFRVLNAGDNWVKVELVYEHKAKQAANSPEEEISTDYEIKWRGRAKWSVVRKADKAVLSENIVEKFEAENWLREHLKAIAL